LCHRRDNPSRSWCGCVMCKLHKGRGVSQSSRCEWHIGSTKGDGLLAAFGHPIRHEDDVSRAVRAGLEITREVSRLSDQSKRRFVFRIKGGGGGQWGQVYLAPVHGVFSGSAANVATRISALAAPGTVVVSDAVESLIRNDFELEPRPPVAVKELKESIIY